MKKTNYHDIDECIEAKKGSGGKKGFLIFYLIFVAVLVLFFIFSLIYVSGVLGEYEESQPDKLARDCAQMIKTAAMENRLEQVISFDTIKQNTDITQEEIQQFQQNIANSNLTVKKSSSKDEEAGVICYNILCDDSYTIAKYKIKSVKQTSKLTIFTLDEWQEVSLEASVFNADFSLPASVSVSVNGKKANGAPSEDGQTVKYSVASVTKPEITITDCIGNSVLYSEEGKYSFKEYKITVPSTFTVKGKEAIPVPTENTVQIEDYENLCDYFSDLPVLCSYDLFILEGGEFPLTITDNYGQNVDISQMGDRIEITRPIGIDTVPAAITNPPDALEITKMWSMFMTDDLYGGYHGFNTMAQYLFKGSSQYSRAWEWATGIDITFTSIHTLSDPPFTKVEIGNYVLYNENCFSCEVLLEKPLHLSTGDDIIDTIHSVFFFGYIDDTDNGVDDPHWGIIDKVGIVE